MNTLIRVFFDDGQIVGVVIPDSDEELDLHHKQLVASPHFYVDLPADQYMEYALENRQPILEKLHAFVRAHPAKKQAVP